MLQDKRSDGKGLWRGWYYNVCTFSSSASIFPEPQVQRLPWTSCPEASLNFLSRGFPEHFVRRLTQSRLVGPKAGSWPN
jgi:hypothetical protein